jgi:1-acyl-sn-glycerol-3-phosphate acyltransferase
MLYLLRILILVPYVAFICLVGTIVASLRPFNPKNIKFVCNFLAFCLKILGVKVVVHHSERLKLNGPFVYISNHQDNFDILPGAFLIPRNTVSIGKKSLKYIPFFGQFYWLSGNILIDRSNKKNAFSTLDQTVSKINDQKISVWIMPEGTRSRGRGLLPFKKGPFVTAIKAQIPIIPIVINSYLGKLHFNKWHAGTIIVDVLEPIETLNKSVVDAGSLKDQVFELMKSTLNRIDHE